MMMPVAVALFALCILPVCLYVTFARMRPILALLSTIVLLATALAPHPPRVVPEHLSYAMIYNRWGYCVFLLPLFTIAVPPINSAKWKDLLDGIIAGAFLAICIFLKINYGLLLVSAVVGFPIVPFLLRIRYGVALTSLRKPAFYGALLGSAILLTCFFGSLIKWDFGAFVYDMRLLAHARWALGIHGFLRAAFFLWPSLCIFITLAALGSAALTLHKGKSAVDTLTRVLPIAVAYAFYETAIVMSNSVEGDLREFPVLAIGSFLILNELIQGWENIQLCQKPYFIKRHHRIWFWIGAELPFLTMCVWIRFSGWREAEMGQNIFILIVLLLMPLCFMAITGDAFKSLRSKVLTAGGYLLALLIAVPATARNMDGLLIAHSYRTNGTKLPADEVFQSGDLNGLQIQGSEGSDFVSTYVIKVADGLQLINQTGNSTKSVAAFDFTDPFNVIRGVKPPAGFPLAWHLHFVFSATAAPDEHQVFNGAEVVMFPKQFGTDDKDTLPMIDHLYGAYLRDRYKLAGESRQWSLWVQK